jgi:hypothetical protein
MFNKYVLKNNPTSYCTKSVKVNEHRAPTDESIRLLNEMQEKAQENIVDKFIVANNELNGNVLIFEDPITAGYKIFVRFRINGELYKFEEHVSQYDRVLFNVEEKLAECMTNAIYVNLVKGLNKNEYGGWGANL